jgi:hypothetical protein
MTADVQDDGAQIPHLLPGMLAGNIANPIKLKLVQEISGFTASAALPGQQVEVITRWGGTSDEPRFHRMAESIAGLIRTLAIREKMAIEISDYKTVLLVLKPDLGAELWLDTAAKALQCITARAVDAGTVVFQHDIADVVAVQFPCVEFGKQDKVLCLMRESWGFALAFDMNPAGDLDIGGFERELGKLLRQLRYRHLYEMVADTESLDRLIAQGWFPFVVLLARRSGKFGLASAALPVAMRSAPSSNAELARSFRCRPPLAMSVRFGA